MTKLRALLLAAAIAAPIAPAVAATDGADLPSKRAVQLRTAPLPPQLDAGQRARYRDIFAAIRSGDWAAASGRLDSMGWGPLHDAARAELYLAKNSPRVELQPLLALLSRSPHLPQAAQLARLAETRGAGTLPELPQAQKLMWMGEQPRRGRARSTRNDSVAAELEARVQQLIVDDQPSAAETLLSERETSLTPEALAEFRQRIAWSYYLNRNDGDARRLADKARSGAGEWALHGEWVAALASWRMNDCAAAADSFAAVGARATDQELSAAGHYWAARADMKCRRPEHVQARLRSAARLDETFYGLLAASALGIRPPAARQVRDSGSQQWQRIADRPNVRAAIALNEIGERSLAGDFVKHQARIGEPREHEALIQLSSALNLPSTQFWLAHNAPRGASVSMAARYPQPDWKPMRGWRVDPALVMAHTLQESSFRTEVVSPAGAYGLMQVRPGTAGDMARAMGQSFERSQLSDPAANFEYGQSYLEYLRDYSGTDGLLPKVIAAYNAGPGPVAAWNGRIPDRGDPLLYIESIPYWETRGYVPIVLRNYWIYEEKSGRDAGSRNALAQGLWPRFPGTATQAVRLSASNRDNDGTR